MSKKNRLENIEKVKTLVEDLRKLSTYGEPTFETLVHLKQVTEAIQLLQDPAAPKEVKAGEVSKRFDQFNKWFADNGGKLNNVAVQRDLGVLGTGLMATGPLNPEQVAVQVPRQLILSVDQARQSPTIGPFLAQDKHVKDLEHLALALFLMHEKHSLRSFWHPYTHVLPREFPHLPFHWRASELARLQGSPALHELCRVFKISCMQYSYVFQNFMCEPSPPIALASLTFSSFLWALSVVWTRKNRIPLAKPQAGVAPALHECLIPMWDFANHFSGKEPFHPTERLAEQAAELKQTQIATFFNFETNCCESHALRALEKGDPFYIYYGDRHRAQVLLYSGFLPSFDLSLVRAKELLAVALVLNDAFEHFTEKEALLERAQLLEVSRGNFPLFPDGRVTDELRSFLSVLVMDADELAAQKASTAVPFTIQRTLKLEARALALLRQTCEELLAAYEPDVKAQAAIEQEEHARDPAGALNPAPAVHDKRLQMAADLVAGERFILKATLQKVRERKQTITKKLKKKAAKS